MKTEEIFGIIASVIVGLFCVLVFIDKIKPTALFMAILLSTVLAIYAYWFCLVSEIGQTKKGGIK